VDADGAFGFELAHRLEGLGYEVKSVATNARAGLLAARAGRPEVALVDLTLRDGILLAKQLRNEVGCDVIFLAPSYDDPLCAFAVEALPHGFLEKPIADSALRVAVALAIAWHRSKLPAERSDGEVTGGAVGPYDLVEVIGHGGMGTVFLGRHRTIKSDVAIKFLSAHLTTSAGAVDRFLFEAIAVNLIDHPNIVKIFDYGVAQDGRQYLVMEYLDGTTLEEFISPGALPLDAAGPILLQVMDALTAAHENGVVHRDLKPTNIMLIPVADRLIVKVLDFGIAKLYGNGDVESAPLGTPDYMAPECGPGGVTDRRTDVYSLGVLMYRIATGRLPFTGDSPIQVLLAHTTVLPPPPRSIRADIPEDYEHLLLRALEKEPNDRFQTIAELRAAFVEVLASARAEGRPTSKERPAFELVRLSRAGERRPAALEVQVRVGDTSRFREMYTRDIHGGGMFVSTEGELPPIGSSLEMVLLGASFGQVSVRGEVVRHVEYPADQAGFGVKLIGLDASARAQLDHVIESLDPRASQSRSTGLDAIHERRNGSHYELLDTPQWVDADAIRTAADRLIETLDAIRATTAAPDRRAIDQLYRAVDRAKAVLLDPRSRAEYDARIGNVAGIAEALRAGLSEMDLADLRRAYLEAHPGVARAARAASTEARLATHAHLTSDAVAAFEVALRLDPLNYDLHRRYSRLIQEVGRPERPRDQIT
jgi:serine/threonine-protein kinase